MNDSAQWDESQEDDFDLRAILFKFLRHWYWYVAALAVALFAARHYLKQFTPIYRVDATLYIKDEWSNRSRGPNDIVQQLDMGASKNLDNEMVVLHSRPLVSKVVENLGLIVTYWHEGKNRDTEIYTDSPVKLEVTDVLSSEPFFIQPLGGGRYDVLDQDKNRIRTFLFSQKINSKYGKFRVFARDPTANAGMPPVKVSLRKNESVVNELVGAVKVGYLNENSTLISVSMETPVPAKGKEILKNLLEECTFTTLEDKNREASNTLRFIEERLKLVTRELGDVEQDVEAYRRAKGITDLGTEATLFLDRAQANDAKLNEIDINLKVLEGVDSYVKVNELGNIAPATLGVNDPVLTSYIDRLSELEAERSKLAQTVQPGNPYLETLNTQMRNVRQAVQENLRNQKSNLLVSRNSLLAMNDRLEGSISTIPRKEREYLGIKRQAGVKENLYLLLLQKREETALSYASTVTDSRVVAPPHATPGPIRPDPNTTYGYALLLALLVPTAFILAKEALKNTVQSKEDIEKRTGLKVFGEISRMTKKESGQMVDLSSRSHISEQIRMILSNMQYLFTEGEAGSGRTILVTSSMGDEGKSFVSLNLAHSLALLDKRVIILGLDLRKPKINEYLAVTNELGLSTYLIGQAHESDIISTTPYQNLYIAPSGPIPPNPSELISTPKMGALIESLRKRFDYIILDTPPVSLVTDAVLLAPFADASFYIVRHEKTPRIYLNSIAGLHKEGRFKSLNVIFNAVNYKNISEYGYRYGYGYGRNGYYGNSEPSGWLERGISLVRKKMV